MQHFYIRHINPIFIRNELDYKLLLVYPLGHRYVCASSSSR